MDLLEIFEKEQMKKNLPQISPGDKVKIYYKIKEDTKERTTSFEGIVIALAGSRSNLRVHLRKIASGGIGVERSFLIHHPSISKIKILKKGKTRRAKLYYLRKVGGQRATRIKEKGTLAEAIVWEKEEKREKEAEKQTPEEIKKDTKKEKKEEK